MGLVLDPSAPDGDGAPEVEITAEMVEAGVSALREETGDECPTFGLGEIVRAVYRAMALAIRMGECQR